MSNVSSKEDGGLPAWGPAAAIIVTVLSLFGSQFLAGFIVALAAGLANAPDNWLASTAGQFYFVLAADIFIVLAILGFLRRRKAKLTDTGLGRRPALLDLGYALVAWLVYFGLFIMLAMAANALTPIDIEQKQELGFEQLFSTPDKVMALISLVILPPLIEEFVFRGFMFTGLRKRFRFLTATLITSLAFASLHLLGSSQGLLWVAGLDTVILSFALCYLREKTGALWAPMALHAIKNAIAFFILLSGVAVL